MFLVTLLVQKASKHYESPLLKKIKTVQLAASVKSPVAQLLNCSIEFVCCFQGLSHFIWPKNGCRFLKKMIMGFAKPQFGQELALRKNGAMMKITQCNSSKIGSDLSSTQSQTESKLILDFIRSNWFLERVVWPTPTLITLLHKLIHYIYLCSDNVALKKGIIEFRESWRTWVCRSS